MNPWLGAAIGLYGFLWACIAIDQGRWTRRGTWFRLREPVPLVALTFDDGPDPIWTPQILDVLDRHGVKATFFLVGDHVRRFPEVARDIAARGHAIGNHTYSHRPLWRLSAEAISADVRRAGEEIAAACGRQPTLFRPPKGLLWPRQKKALARWGYDVVMWSLNTKDWAGPSPRRLAASVIRRARAGDIVLFHDGGGVVSRAGGNRAATVAALGPIIEAFQKRGWGLVSLASAPSRA